MKKTLLSLFLFVLAGLLEIGGGYLIWKGVKEDHLSSSNRILLIVLGAVILVMYGFVPTLQPDDSSFGRVYAVYGGFFIVLSYCWSMVVENFQPDIGDIIGGGIALLGVGVAWFWPR